MRSLSAVICCGLLAATISPWARRAKRTSTVSYTHLDVYKRQHHPLLQIVWTTALEIGHPEIDANHRAMLSLLNHVLAASYRSDQAEVRGLLLSLIHI